MKILITGSAGFIGYHLAKRLINEGHEVVGIDNLNHYYDVKLKLHRLADLGIDVYEIAKGKMTIQSSISSFRFIKLDLKEDLELMEIFQLENFEIVLNMAAQAGVRYSIENPQTYITSNIVGFANLLEACRHYPVKNLVYASSSSVYGNTKSTPFKTSDMVDKPISLYAATKKSNELMAHTYSHLFDLPTTGLRFFTVYGEWGRPDMAAMLFAKAIMSDKPIKVFNHGKLSRDFTYIGDIVEGILKVMNRTTDNNNIENYKIYNIGNSEPVNLLEFIETMEDVLGKKAIKEMYPMQQGDVETTYADVSDLINEFDYRPKTTLKVGLSAFAKWYLKYYHKKNILVENEANKV